MEASIYITSTLDISKYIYIHEGCLIHIDIEFRVLRAMFVNLIYRG